MTSPHICQSPSPSSFHLHELPDIWGQVASMASWCWQRRVSDPYRTLSPLGSELCSDWTFCCLGRRLLTWLAHWFHFLYRGCQPIALAMSSPPRSPFLGSLLSCPYLLITSMPWLLSWAPQGPLLAIVIDKIMTPKNIYILISETWQYVTLHDQRVFADMTELKILR